MNVPEPYHAVADAAISAEPGRLAQLAADSLAEGLCVLDGDGLMRYVNAAFQTQTGRLAAELLKRPYLGLIHPEDRERVDAALRSARGGTGQAQAIHRKMLRKGGVTLCAASWSPLFDGDRRLIGVLGRESIMLGHTWGKKASRRTRGRIEAEEALRESEARFRQMADLLPQPLYETADDGVITYANRAGLCTFGYSEEDMRHGVRAIDLIAPEDRHRVRTDIRNLCRGGPARGNEYLARRKDGSTFPSIVFSAPILRDGQRAGTRGIVVDITERVRTEEALRETALKFRQLAETISEVFFIKDAQTRRTLYISPAYEVIWGQTCQSFYDRPESFRESVHPEDREQVEEDLKRQGLGMPTSAEYRIIRPDGAVRWIRSKTFPVRNSSGDVYRIVGAAEDITERRLAEEALMNHAAHLQALSSRLTAVREAERRSIARELHDEIGQLATGLKLGLDLLTNSVSGPAADQASRLAVTAAELISEVRNLSLGLRPSMLDDLGLFPALAWLFRRTEDQTGITVEFTHQGIDRRFPASAETVVYRAVQEALTNAARHADVDAITVSVVADAETISASVADRGRGFQPAEVLASPESTGLFGMRERVDAIGGALSITSAPGEGTTITIQLPITERAGDHGNDDHTG